MKTKLLLIAVFLLAPMIFAEDSEQLLTVDHYVRVKSTVPSIAGQTSQNVDCSTLTAATINGYSTLQVA